ncbi:T9SS type A sorting domain-containing protein, partial [bacterium]|nr:T9SS type A sorting domain-containing protein [bacterium]
NPFNPITNITFGIPNQQQSVRVQVFVYDLLGKLVKTLVNEEKTPGYYTVAWDGTNQIGNKVTSGLYVCRMEAGSYRNTRKMVLWK